MGDAADGDVVLLRSVDAAAAAGEDGVESMAGNGKRESTAGCEPVIPGIEGSRSIEAGAMSCNNAYLIVTVRWNIN